MRRPYRPTFLAIDNPQGATRNYCDLKTLFAPDILVDPLATPWCFMYKPLPSAQSCAVKSSLSGFLKDRTLRTEIWDRLNQGRSNWISLCSFLLQIPATPVEMPSAGNSGYHELSSFGLQFGIDDNPSSNTTVVPPSVGNAAGESDFAANSIVTSPNSLFSSR